MHEGRERKRERDRCMLYGVAHTRSAMLCARRGFRYSGASAARKKPKHYRYWWPSCRTDRVDLSVRRKEIFLRGGSERGGDRATGNRRWYAKAEIYDNICRGRTSREMKFPRYGLHFSRRDLFPPTANFTVVTRRNRDVGDRKAESLMINFFFI